MLHDDCSLSGPQCADGLRNRNWCNCEQMIFYVLRMRVIVTSKNWIVILIELFAVAFHDDVLPISQTTA